LPTLTVERQSAGDSAQHALDDKQPAGAPRRRIPVGESVVRGALANLSSQPLTWGASLLLAAVVPRLLGSETLGHLTLALTIVNLAAPVLDLGIVDYLTRRVAQNPRAVRRDVGVALVVQAVTFSIGAVVIAAVAPRLAASEIDVWLLYLALMTLVVGCAQSILLAALRGQERHAQFAWFSASKWVIGTVGTVAILLIGGDVVAYMSGAVVLCVLTILGNWKLSGLRPTMPHMDSAFVEQAREIVRGGLPFLGWNITMNFYGSIDRLLLAWFVPAAQIGWYAAANRIVGIPVVIPTVLTTPLLPALSRSVHDPQALRRVIAHTLRIALLCTVPLSAGIYIVAPAVPGLLGWGQDFDQAVPLMMILSLQMPLVAVDMVLGTVIMSIGRERMWLKVGLLAAVVNVSANLIAIPFFASAAQNGAIGASIATVVTELCMLGGALALVPKHLLERGTLWSAARIVFAGAAAAAVAAPFMSVALVLAAVLGGITYLMLCFLLRVLQADDLAYVMDTLVRRRQTRQANV
jgi:O-antigen/teichoic acid export membrane protein